MAKGVLVIAVNKALKLVDDITSLNKEYIAEVTLGIKTDTLDITGNVLEKEDITNINKEFIEEVLNSFIGEYNMEVPIYSAVKVNGKKLYEYARKGQQVEIKPRNIEIYDIELIKVNKEEKQMQFKVRCSKGTYIRTLCENIAEEMQTVGYMKELKRTKVGKFTIEQAITIEQLKEGQNIKVITIEEMFEEKEKIQLEDDDIKLLLNGVKLKKEKQDGIYKIYSKTNKFIGTGIIENGRLKVDIRI